MVLPKIFNSSKNKEGAVQSKTAPSLFIMRFCQWNLLACGNVKAGLLTFVLNVAPLLGLELLKYGGQ